MRFAQWNVNGWNTDRLNPNTILREKIITLLDYDVIALCETHLRESQAIDLTGYTFFGHNRLALSVNAVRGSGGVGLLAKNKLVECFKIDIIDKSFEGIMWINFTDRYDPDCTFKICACYLPPEGSSRGNIAQEFFETLLYHLPTFRTVPVAVSEP